MDAIIKDSLPQSMSYQTYRDLVKRLSETNGTTGHEKTEALIGFTKLNEKRMKRLDKTIKISQDLETQIKGFYGKVTWLVILESWCGDAAHVTPVLNKIAELNENIDLKIVLRDDNEDLMNAFLTNGNKSVPKLIMIDDESGDVLNTYGPRPSQATSYVNQYKAMYGKLTQEFKEDLQRWYNKDKGQNIIEDITEMLCKAEPSFCL